MSGKDENGFFGLMCWDFNMSTTASKMLNRLPIESVAQLSVVGKIAVRHCSGNATVRKPLSYQNLER